MSIVLTTVTEDLDLPGQGPVKTARVTYDLVGEGGKHLPEAYDADGATIISHLGVDSSDGTTTVELVGNADIIPAGTAWRRSVSIQHDPTPRTDQYLLVPADGGTYALTSLLVDAPGPIPPAALAAHKAQIGVPSGHLPAGDPDDGDTLKWDEGAGTFVYAPPDEVVELPRSYRHHQDDPALVWLVVHNLGFRPSDPYVEDSAGSQHWPARHDVDDNTLELIFVGESDGWADFS